MMGLVNASPITLESYMPSKTPAQKRLMAAAAHTPGGFGGVSQSVGKEFNQADKGKKLKKGGTIKPLAKGLK